MELRCAEQADERTLLELVTGQAIGERCKRVESEQQLPGTFRKRATNTKAGYFGWSKIVGKVWF